MIGSEMGVGSGCAFCGEEGGERGRFGVLSGVGAGGAFWGGWGGGGGGGGAGRMRVLRRDMPGGKGSGVVVIAIIIVE